MLPDRRVVVAQLRAHEDANELILPPPDKVTRQLNVAVGDPQASINSFFKLLDLNGLLGDDGRLRPEVGLVSMGDHFDWGRKEDRERATDEGTMLLSWLAAHPPDQVQIIFGNHDLVRVGELSWFSDEGYQEARALADAVENLTQEAEFKVRYPNLASPAVISRDFSCFEVRQRALMTRLLKKRRGRLAVAGAPDLLMVHAGLTVDDLDYLGVSHRDAPAIAASLNRFLESRVSAWSGEGPIDLSPLHELGSAASGEARGILSHRPANPDVKKVDRNNRRYDPRNLPSGLVQVIGHINDKKCRELLGAWVPDKHHEFGTIRGLRLNPTVEYHFGVDERDAIIFLDGALSQVEPFEYQLFDVELRQPLVLR